MPSESEVVALVEQWIGLPAHLVDKVIAPQLSPKVISLAGGRDALLSEGNWSLWQAARKFNPAFVSERTGQPVKFNSYAMKVIHRRLWRFVNERVHGQYVYGAEMETFADGADSLAELEQSELVQVALRALQPREQEIIQARFFDGLTLKDAGERVGVGSERARQIEARALKVMARALSPPVDLKEQSRRHHWRCSAASVGTATTNSAYSAGPIRASGRGERCVSTK